MSSWEAFEAARQTICTSGPASSGVDLGGMAIDCEVYLARTEQFAGSARPAGYGVVDLWHDGQIKHGESGNWLIEGTATATAGVEPDAVTAELHRLWSGPLKYPYREAHIVLTEPNRTRSRCWQ